MTKYREILRLLSNQLKTDDIVHACNVSKKTVIKVKKRAEKLEIHWPFDADMTDEKLETIMFPKPEKPVSTKRMPDFDHVRKELLRNGVNKKLLWTEYLEQCRREGADALMYSQFCFYIQHVRGKLILQLRGCGRNPGPNEVINRRRSRTCIPTKND